MLHVFMFIAIIVMYVAIAYFVSQLLEDAEQDAIKFFAIVLWPLFLGMGIGLAIGDGCKRFIMFLKFVWLEIIAPFKSDQ